MLANKELKMATAWMVFVGCVFVVGGAEDGATGYRRRPLLRAPSLREATLSLAKSGTTGEQIRQVDSQILRFQVFANRSSFEAERAGFSDH
jgi:hypothetical protein